jgi:hypothetical protein
MPRTPTSRPRRLFNRAALATLAGLLVVAGIACGGDDDDGGETGTDPTAAETTTTASTTAPLTTEEQAKAVYLELVALVERLTAESPDPDDPTLATLAVDPVLSDLRDSLTTLRSENQIWQVGDRTSHSVYSAEINDQGQARLKDCVVENDVLLDRDDGSVVRTTPTTTRDVRVTLTDAGGRWAVAEVETLQAREGEVACT